MALLLTRRVAFSHARGVCVCVCMYSAIDQTFLNACARAHARHLLRVVVV